MAQPFTLPGNVYLIEAGSLPGKQLTRRLQDLLIKADLVLHEELLSENVSAVISVHASVQDVRKSVDGTRISPEELQRRMIAAARNGQSVVRLKGSDPSSFGDTQEELAALREAKIDFEIVPAASAAAASAAGQLPPVEREVFPKHVP